MCNVSGRSRASPDRLLQSQKPLLSPLNQGDGRNDNKPISSRKKRAEQVDLLAMTVNWNDFLKSDFIFFLDMLW
jgi:hypothetical protein